MNAFLAEVASNFDWTGPLGSVGVAGAMLYWFAFRVERRLKASDDRMTGIETSQNRMTRAVLMLVLSLNQHAAGAAARVEAKNLSDEIEESERERERVRKGSERD